MSSVQMLDSIASHESAVRGYVRSFPAVFQSATGSWLTTHDGRRYLDFFAGAGALNYGHNNPLVKAALLEYIAADGVQHGLDLATEAKVGFLNTFTDTILRPRKLDYKLQFTGPTGTNAVEAATKLARKLKQRSHIVAFTNAYHGHSLGSLALTGNQYYHDEHYGSHNNVTHLPYDGYLGDFDTSLLLEKMLADSSSGLPKPAAVILETIQGEGGVRVAKVDWLRRVAELCQQHDVLLIVDDIQVGNGRTGTFFSFEPSGIKPDLVCLSKSIGGGLPMSLLLIKPECDGWSPGQHTGTFRGNNLAFVAGRALLSYWESDGFATRIAQSGQLIESRLCSLAARYPHSGFQVRGRGMIWGLDVQSGELAQQISSTAFEQGLVIETSGATDQVVKLLPPLTTEYQELQAGLDLLERAVEITLAKQSDSDQSALPQQPLVPAQPASPAQLVSLPIVSPLMISDYGN